MNTTELTIITFTLGYKPKHKRIQAMCGTYAAAKMLKRRGYSLSQALQLLNR